MTMSIGIIETRSIAIAAELLNQLLKLYKIKIINIEFPGNGNVTVFLSGEYSHVKNALSASEKISTGFRTAINSRIISKPDDKLFRLLGLVKMESHKSVISSKQKDEKQKITIDKDKTGRDNAEIKHKSEQSKIAAPEKESEVVQPIKSFTKRIRIKPNAEKSKPGKNEITITDSESSDSPVKIRVDNPTIAKLRMEALGKKSNVDLKMKSTIPAEIQSGNALLLLEQLEELNVHKLRRYARNFTDFPIKGREISRANRDELLNYFKDLV